jgi:metal-responsive CopG/Arc/MetJ family transcriptional regulator
MTKVTFTLDDETVEAIRAIAARKNKPRSLVIREAVAAYASQEEKLDDAERTRRLRVLDDLMARPRTRPQAEVDDELHEIRRARRAGWRRPPE